MAQKTVRALARGIQILRALQRSNSGASLNDLHQMTKISRPTLLRLIATLEQEELVWRRLSTGLYMVSANFNPPSIIPDPHIKLAEIAAPVLRQLVKKIIWPSDLAVLHPDFRTCMYAIDSSRFGTPFPVHRSTIGQFVNLPWTAVGRAYLAYCPDAEREELIKGMRRSSQTCDRVTRDPKKIEQILDHTRAKGYATRDQQYFGGHYEDGQHTDDRLSAIAIPIHDQNSVIACINVVWLRGVHDENHIVKTCLPHLREAAKEIAKLFSQQNNWQHILRTNNNTAI